jgi:hypothetical protein
MSSMTLSSHCREPPATYRLNATGINFEYLRKYISSYVDGASIRGSIRREDVSSIRVCKLNGSVTDQSHRDKNTISMMLTGLWFRYYPA